jgi:site-specific recombinase XerD
MQRTSVKGVYKRGSHYVVTWRHRGRQHKSFHRTLAEARDAKAQRPAGDRRSPSRVNLETYFEQWVETHAVSESTRPEYRRPIEAHALPRWRTWRLDEVQSSDVRELLGELRTKGATTSQVKKLRAALSAMFSTAVEDGKVLSNPVRGVRIKRTDDEDDGKAKAMTREELRVLLAALPDDWRLFFELLAHTGLRFRRRG